jgi:hypothetical protein
MGCGLNFDLSTSHPPIQTYPHLSTGKTQVIHILVHKLSTLLQLGRMEESILASIVPTWVHHFMSSINKLTV